jgi:hypothetical protein
LSLDEGSTAFAPNKTMPDPQFDGTFYPLSVILPFFDDLIINTNNRDGLWYYANSSYAAFQWRVTNQVYNPEDGQDEYDFIAEYHTTNPGIWYFTYNALGMLYNQAEIGIQTDNMSEYCGNFVR